MQTTSIKNQADKSYVAEQYADTERLDARIRLYQDFRDPRDPSLTSWVFSGLGLQPGMRVLEVGAGTGLLWAENFAQIPEGLTLTISDNSPAMLEAAKARLGDAFEYRLMAVEGLSVPDAEYDVVIANHMLYHVAHRAEALSEIRRVLRPGGRLYATTNGWTHIIELRTVIERFHPEAHVVPARHTLGVFDVEQGADELRAVFDQLKVLNYRSRLEVTDADALVNYVQTILPNGPSAHCGPLRNYLQQIIDEQGHFHIGIWVGLFVATK